MPTSEHTPRSVMVTGGAGFIGCNLVRHLLDSDPQITVVNFDKLTYAGSLLNFAGVAEQHAGRYHFVRGDICDWELVRGTMEQFGVDTVIHLAAESHVDRSIDAPAAFIETNVVGTYTLLEVARELWHKRDGVRFHHVSTDEVFGSLSRTGRFIETTPYDPSSPYSASKAASDHLARAWQRTYGLPLTISNCSNNYGPYQHPEKLIPLMICKALKEGPLPVYGDGQNVRDWLHAEDHCRAIDAIVRRGRIGETYNVGGHNEWANIDLVQLLCHQMDEMRPRSGGTSHRELITFVQDRPGHDRRYAMDAGKIERELGWRPKRTFEQGLRETIRWYLEHGDWIGAIARDRYAGERLGLKG